MVNYCYNEVALSGEPARLLKALAYFAGLAEKPVSMPDFITADQRQFLDLSIGDNNVLGFRTRWNPNLDVMAEVSRHFGLDHRHFYL